MSLTDEEWNILEPLLPPARKKQGGRPPKDRRQMLGAVLWVARTGAPQGNAIFSIACVYFIDKGTEGLIDETK